jgi:SAM-dependent methyltransferase
MVDDFMRDAVGARALHSALELGFIDALPGDPARLREACRLDAPGFDLLCGLLRSNRVIEGGVNDGKAGELRLTGAFRAALERRDLLEAKLEFARMVAPDFTGLFTELLADPQRFFERSKLFELFSYDRCYEPTPENYAATQRWVRITTALTRYEAPACLERHDFARHRRMLDVGGNSGEFALQACRRNPALRATVYDLPLVCDLGVEHVRAEPEAGRIEFARVTRPAGAPPRGFDLVSFKSMLHDWPDAQMRRFLAEAHRSLEPGGTLLIFERGRFDPGRGPVPWSQVPLLLFFRSYRGAEAYESALAEAGFRGIRSDSVELDMPFILVSASK